MRDIKIGNQAVVWGAGLAGRLARGGARYFDGRSLSRWYHKLTGRPQRPTSTTDADDSAILSW